MTSTKAKDFNINAVDIGQKVSIGLDFPIATIVDPIGKAPTPMDYSIPTIIHVENYKGLCKIVTVAVCPFEYNSDKSELYLNEKIKYSISYIDGEDKVDVQRITAFPKVFKDDLKFLQSIAYNSEDVENLFPPIESIGGLINPTEPPIKGYQYTIITTEELAPYFERLVTLKEMQGIKAGIVTMEEIETNPHYATGDTESGINTPAGKLKAFLMSNKYFIEYVLLGGKPPLVPVIQCSQLQGLPTDLYYGTENTDWVNHYNGSIGGWYYDFNYSSLFKIGRLLCTSGADINNYLDKLDIYELNPGLGDRSYLEKALSYVGNTYNPEDDSSIYHYLENVGGQGYGQNGIECINTLMNNNFTQHQFFGSRTSQITGAELVQKINENKLIFSNIHGHGVPEGITTYNNGHVLYGMNGLDAETVYHTTEDGNGLDCMDNFGYPGIFYAGSCSTAAFDSPSLMGFGGLGSQHDILSKNIAESFTLGHNYGGVCYIGYTREAFASTTFVTIRDLLKSLSQNDFNREIAPIINHIRLPLTTDSDSHEGKLALNIIGDPSISLWNGTEDISNVTPVNIVRRDSTIMVRLPSNLISDGYRVSLIQPNGVFRCQEFTDVDSVVFNHVSKYSALYVSAPNRIPYIDDIIVDENVLYDNSRYLYCNNLTLGTNRRPIGPLSLVTFTSSDFVFDATGDVHLKSNLVIPDGCTVHILTPGTCYFEGVGVLDGGCLRVSAGNVVRTSAINNAIADGRIVLTDYDKYGINNTQTNFAPANSPQPERLLEVGKEWKYTMVVTDAIKVPNFEPYKKPWEYNRVLRIDGTTEIDGKEYFVLNSYGDFDDYENPKDRLLLREDVDEGKVWVRLEWDNRWRRYFENYYNYSAHLFNYRDEGGEFPYEELLYDFNDNERSLVTFYANLIGESYITWSGGEVLGKEYKVGDFRNYMISRNLGVLSYLEEELFKGSTDLFGYANSTKPAWPNSDYRPFLYEICDGEGNVLFSDPRYYPHCTDPYSTSIVSAKTDADVKVTGRNIQVNAKGEVKIYNSVGQVVHREYVNCTKDIDASRLPSGIYIIEVSGKPFKVSI